MDEIMLVYTTWPDAETAEAAGEAVAEAGLAACANILSPMRSIYRWRDAICREAEAVMLLKTRAGQADALRRRIVSLHPHDTPCVVALPIDMARSRPEFLDWVREQTKHEATT